MGNSGGKSTKGPRYPNYVTPRVRIRATTYTKDSYGLFDFQRKDNYTEEIFDLTSSGKGLL